MENFIFFAVSNGSTDLRYRLVKKSFTQSNHIAVATAQSLPVQSQQ